MPKYKVLTDFDQALDCRTTVSHAEGDLIDVPEGNVESWVEAGFIDETPVKGKPGPKANTDKPETEATGFFGGKKKKS